MAELKTKLTAASAEKFLASVKDPRRRADSEVVLEMMKKATGEKPRMWGSAIVGFGMYHYRSERSTQEGDWPMTGFSPRKQALTVYLMPGFQKEKTLLKELGPHTKSSGSCLYIKDLSKIDQKALTSLIKKSYQDMKKKYG